VAGWGGPGGHCGPRAAPPGSTMKHSFFLLAGALALALSAAAPALAQTGPGVGIGTTAPDASAALDIVSSSKGALLPRLSEAARLAMGTGTVPAPATGLLVYQTDGASPGFYYASSPSTWTRLTDGATADGRYIQNQSATDQAASFRISGNALVGGRVGIGTSSPTAQLSNTSGAIAGSDANGGGNGTLAWAASQQGYVGQFFNGNPSNARGLAVKVAGTDASPVLDVSSGAAQGTLGTPLLTVQANGLVGIGTSTQLTRLSISPNTTEPKLTLWDGGIFNSHFGFGVTPGQLNYHVSNTSGNHVFYVGGKNGNGTELLRITGGGRVGIGTSTPAGQLANTNGNTVGSDNYGGNAGSLNWATSQYGYAVQVYNGDTGGASNGLLVKIDGTNPTAVALDVSKGAQTTPGTRLLMVQASGAVTVGTLAGTGTRLVTADANGTLGSGTAASLDATIASNGLTLAGADVRLGGPLTQATTLNTNGYNLTLTGTGRLGVGTSAPISQLANTDTGILGTEGLSSNTNSLTWAGSQYGYLAALYNGGTGAGNNGLALKVAGNDPLTAVLDVSSNAAQATVGTSLLNVRANGRVGIGTNSPATSLDVNGALTLRPAAAALAVLVDNQLVDAGNRSYLRLNSNSTTATSRTLVLADGAQPGQLLYLEGANTLNNAQCELLDTGNVNLPANRTISYVDVLTLLWNGSQWLEVSYTNN
jgi:hypothetical protein